MGYYYYKKSQLPIIVVLFAQRTLFFVAKAKSDRLQQVACHFRIGICDRQVFEINFKVNFMRRAFFLRHYSLSMELVFYKSLFSFSSTNFASNHLIFAGHFHSLDHLR